MQVSELNNDLQTKMNKQYRAIQVWASLNKLPFKTFNEIDIATTRWVSSGCAESWNNKLKG